MITARIGDTSSLNKKRKVHTSAGCYLIRKKKDSEIELLIIKKTWPDNNIRYVLPKGHVEKEETLEEAAHREVMEESGYRNITLLRYLGSSTYELDWDEIKIKTDHYYLALLNNEDKVSKQKEVYENDVKTENQWMKLDEGFKLLTFENNKKIHVLVKQYIEEDVLLKN